MCLSLNTKKMYEESDIGISVLAGRMLTLVRNLHYVNHGTYDGTRSNVPLPGLYHLKRSVMNLVQAIP